MSDRRLFVTEQCVHDKKLRVRNKIIHSLAWITIFGHSWCDLPLIFSRDFVTRENHWQITPLVTKNSLFTVTHALFVMSLITGIFPDELKIAKVVPFYKKGDIAKCDNYRPILLLSAISKLFEELYEYFTRNTLFHENQYGFRTNHSTEIAVTEWTDRILINIENKSCLWQSSWIYLRRLTRLIIKS